MRALIAGLALIWACGAMATERDVAGGSAASNASAAASGGSGGSGGIGGSVTSRAVGVGLSAAANSSTCYVPVLFGMIQWPDPHCQRNDDLRALQSMGLRDAMIQRACQDPALAEAIAASAEARACKK